MQPTESGRVAADATAESIHRFGYVAAVSVSALTLLTFVVAIFTPPLSGPNCTAGCFEYPYVGIESRFPRDYYWMFIAMLLLVAYVALLVAVVAWAPAHRRIYAQTGLLVGAIGAGVLLVNYFVQVTVIQPSLLAGEREGIALWTQFNPHGLFIALEEIGFLLMSLSFLGLAPAFARRDRLERAIRWVLLGGFGLAALAVVAITAIYGVQREYTLEIAVISVVFLVLIVAGALLARLFQRVRLSGEL